MNQERLKHVADVRVSNVDKASTEGDPRVKLCNYTDVYYNERITSACAFMEATATVGQRATFGLEQGDVVLTKDSETADDIGVSAFVAEDVPDLVCGYHLAVVRAHAGRALGGYLRWVLSSALSRQRMSAAATGVTRFGLRSEAITDLRVPIPSLTTQHAVATFLDRETERIDALVAAKRRMVELMADRFEARLMDLLFGGLPNRMVPLRRMADCLAGYAFPSGEFVGSKDDSVRLLRGANVAPGGTRWEDVVYWPLAKIDGPIERYRLRADDIVVGMDRPLIKGGMRVATVRPSDLPALLVQRVARLRAKSLAINAYLRYLLTSKAFESYFSPITTGVSVPHISEDQILSFPVPETPRSTQEEVVATLEEEESRVAELRAVVQRQIVLLQERRRALITASVTGQLDVPEVA